MSDTRTWYVYSLVDPRTDRVRYVGWTINVPQRLANHIGSAKRGEKSYKGNWIRQLIALNLSPRIEVLEEGTGDWAEAEMRWIARFRATDCKLTNRTAGGEGCVGMVHSPETRAKIAQAHLGRKLSPEHIEKVAAKLRGRKRPPEVMAPAHAALAGRVVSEETKRKIGAARRGKGHTDEAKAKISATHKGKPLGEEHKARIGAANAKKRRTEQEREKIARTLTGRKLSEEHRAAILQGQERVGHRKGWKHTPEMIVHLTAKRRERAVRQLAAKAENEASQPRLFD